MRLGILRTGSPPGQLAERFGEYDDMFRRLLGLDGRAYDVAAGQLPERPEDEDAYLITGSPAGVYDDLPWIPPLKGFLREAKGKAALAGICFGHQIMAEAFGGRVEKSEKGWGVGLHRYEIVRDAPWMDGAGSIAVPASHQDQVTVPPPDARLIAASGFTAFAGFEYQDQPAISFQFHPEFEPEFAKELIAARRDRVLDADAAIASLDAPDDRARVGRWIRRFLEGRAA